MKTVLICVCFVAATLFGSNLLKGKENIPTARVVSIDTAILGMWRTTSDTDSKNFFLVQSYYDLHDAEQAFRERVRNGTAGIEKDTALMRRLKLTYEEYKQLMLTDRWGFQKEFEANKNIHYLITYFNRGGRNPLYQEWTSFRIKIKNNEYLAIPGGPGHTEGVLVKLLYISAGRDSMQVAVVNDAAIYQGKKDEEICKILQQNERKLIYKDTLHFYRFNKYHSRLNPASEMVSGRR